MENNTTGLEQYKEHKELATIGTSRDLAKITQFLQLMNVKPNAKFIKKNKFANNSNYLPIGHIEHLLDSFFPEWDMIVVDSKIMGNSIAVTVRLSIVSPISGKTITRDGVGACPIELEATKYNDDGTVKKQGARNAIDLEFISAKGVQKNLPTAKSLALKNAAQTIADIFGRAMNREDDIFIPIYDSENKFTQVLNDDYNWDELQALFDLKELALSEQEKVNAKRIISGKEKNNFNKLYDLMAKK